MKLRRESPTPPSVSDVSADAMGWSGLEPLEPRLLLAGTAPVFLEPLGDHLTTQDESFTVVIDSFDADGDALTISASSTNPDVVPTVTQSGTFARLNFVDDLGAEMGYIMIELFPALTPNAVDRFITLATNELIDDGEGGVDLDPNGTPYYTDVVVHRVMDDFMFQTGDAEFGDGTGGSLLGQFADEFDPSLDFSGPGVVAMANSGPGTQDSQFFITEVATAWLDGVHTIFGQMLSGWDVYHTIMGLPTDAGDRPDDPPLLQSVEIFDTVVSLTAPDDYVGAADITVSLDDGNGNVTEDTFTMTYDADVTDPVVTVNALTTADNTPTLTGTVVDEDDAAAIVVTVNGVAYDATNNGDGTWSVAVTTPLAVAVYDVGVTATDAEGNVGTDATTNELTITALSSVTIDPLVTNDTTPELTGTVSGTVDTITVTVDGIDYSATDNGDTTWTLDDDTIAPALSDGTYDVTVTVSDGLGGEFTDGTVDELVIETVAPEVTVDDVETVDNQPELTGTVDDPDATITLTVNGEDYDPVNRGDGTWWLSKYRISPSLDVGTYDVSVTATDEAGNVGTDETTDELTVLSQVMISLAGSSQPGPKMVRYTDPDGTVVKVTILNGQSIARAQLTFTSTTEITMSSRNAIRRNLTSADGVLFDSLRITSDTGKVFINARGGTDRGATLGSVTGSATLNCLVGRNVDLVDEGVNMPNGLIRSLTLRNIMADITMGGATPPRVRGIYFKVSQGITDSNITITNTNVHSFITGSMVRSSLYVGVSGAADVDEDGVNDLPPVADITGEFRINFLRIRGYRGAVGDLFVNSNVAAGRIGSATLKNVALDNGGTVFGLAANTLRSAIIRQTYGRARFVRGNWRSALDMQDMVVRLV